jgi:hypothetical protein
MYYLSLEKGELEVHDFARGCRSVVVHHVGPLVWVGSREKLLRIDGEVCCASWISVCFVISSGGEDGPLESIQFLSRTPRYTIFETHLSTAFGFVALSFTFASASFILPDAHELHFAIPFRRRKYVAPSPSTAFDRVGGCRDFVNILPTQRMEPWSVDLASSNLSFPAVAEGCNWRHLRRQWSAKDRHRDDGRQR